MNQPIKNKSALADIEALDMIKDSICSECDSYLDYSEIKDNMCSKCGKVIRSESMNLIINTWEYLMGNPNLLPDTTVTLDLYKSCLCCDMLCPPPKPRDLELPDGTVIKEQLRFTEEDNIAYICELATSLDGSDKPGIEIIVKPGYASDEMLLSMLASTAETLNQPIYLTLKTKLFATDEEE